jgi:hypothetical protein
MTRALSVVLAMAALVLCTGIAKSVGAQPLRSQPHAQQLATLPAIKDAIVKVIGAEPSRAHHRRIACDLECFQGDVGKWQDEWCSCRRA